MTESIFDRARAVLTRSFIESEFGAPGSFWRDEQYMTLNPLRPEDRNIGSFSIRTDGKCFDFATYQGGDIFDILAAREGKTAKECALGLLGEADEERPVDMSPYSADPLTPQRVDKGQVVLPDWRPIPYDRPPNFRAQPSVLTLFYDSDLKTPMYYVVRYNKTGAMKKKVIFPIYWTGTKYYVCLPPNLKSRTVLPFDKRRPVVLLEGERKTEMARNYDVQGKYSYTCWHGGAGQAKAGRIDLSPFAGCNVILFPDNDDESREGYNKIALALKNSAASVDIVRLPPDVRKGYDIADVIEEGRDLFTILASAEPYRYDQTSIEADVPEYTNPTDLGNAERLISMYKGRIRYNTDKNKWMVWTGRSWSDEDQSLITPMIKECVRSIIAENPDSDTARAHSFSSESSGRIAGMLSLAAREPGIPVTEEQLDRVTHIIAAPNGTINLKTGELMEAKPEHLCSKTLAIDYHKGAECPRFMQFLSEIMEKDLEKIEFLQRWFGYSLTADLSAQSFLILYGTGANGKSTLVELLARIVGSYAKSAPPDTFVIKQSGAIPNDIAALRGARLVLSTETEANARLAESRVKYMTGGDRISARFMRGEFFEFVPQWHICISTNHRPRVSGGDFGIWRRVLLLPFKFQADGATLDQGLPTKLWAERAGVLDWMVQGAVKWYRDGMGRSGLRVPASILTETQEYRTDEDLIGRFINEACLYGVNLPVDKQVVDSSVLFNTFRNWAEREGERFYAQMTQTSFGRAMRERGYASGKIKGGGRGYTGIYPREGLTADEEKGRYYGQR